MNFDGVCKCYIRLRETEILYGYLKKIEKIYEQKVEMVNRFRIKTIMALDATFRYKSSEILARDSLGTNEIRERNERNEYFYNEIWNHRRNHMK